MGIPCWSAQVSLVEAVEAQQVRLQVTSTTAASHTPAPRSSKKKPPLLVPLAFAPSFSGNVFSYRTSNANLEYDNIYIIYIHTPYI